MSSISTSETNPGAGIDADPARRPGVPMEQRPAPMGAAHWSTPERQEPRVRVLRRAELSELTPVFSNAIPPRGLSGILRRVAYRIPDHRFGHWALLLLGDRVDVLEHRLLRALTVVGPLALLGGAATLVSRATRGAPRRRVRAV